jgi:hypothetical protein
MSATMNGFVERWHAATNRLIVFYARSAIHEINMLSVSQNGRLLAICGQNTADYGKAIAQIWKITY